MTDRVIQEKLSRLRTGGRPRVLDLFSGCGGLSLGFSTEGFEIAAAIESNPTAAAAYGANFHADDPRHARHRDITSTTPGQLVRALKLGRMAEAFDVVIGGPPCQAFARVGRSKLREIEAHPEAFRHDPRATLCTPYLSYVKSCRPLALLMENVPDVMNFGGHNVPEEVCEVLEDLGYVCGYTLLNAAFYGVPQTRERMFLIAYRREIASSVTFPRPTHWVDLPPGYEGSRRVALKALSNGDMFAEAHNYTDPPKAANTLPPAVTAEEAIGDLPEIDARALMRSGVLKRGARRFDTLTPYDESRSVSEYARSMKSWAGFEAGDGVYDHVIRYLPRDYPLFARMKEGDQYPEAHRLALTMLDEKLLELAKKSVALGPGSPGGWPAPDGICTPAARTGPILRLPGARRPAGEPCICRGPDITAMPDLTAAFCLRPSLTPAPISPPAIIPPGTAARRPSASCTPGTPESCWAPAWTGPSTPSFAGPAMAGPSPAARAWASASPGPTASRC